MSFNSLMDRFHARFIVRAVSAVLLASVFFMLYHWGQISYATLDFARAIPILLWLLIALTGYLILTIFVQVINHEAADTVILFALIELLLFLVLLADITFAVSMGVLVMLIVAVFVAWPWLSRRAVDPGSRKFVVILSVLCAPLLLLLFYRLFGTAGTSFFITQKSLGLNFVTLIFLSVLWGCAIGTLLHQYLSKPRLERLSARRLAAASFALAAVIHILSVGLILVYKYWCYRTTTYDFGLFAQMFEYMRVTGLPLTTLERNGLLTHFAVHLSPIYYVLLPFYMIWPDPAMLQIMQPVVVASGLIPLLLLTRHLKLKPVLQVILAFIYVMHPGIIGSSLYDLHENCFLAPLLFWVILFLEKRRWPGFLIASALVLMVKEDAALYLLAIAIYAIFSRRQRRFGLVLFVLASAYFTFALFLLSKIGSGPMVGRFDNVMAEPSLGLLSIPLTLLRNPAYLISQIFTEEKIVYIFKMLLPMGFLPLLNRHLRSWVLLIPFAVMNLISAYPYQYQLGFQYHYGSTVMLLYVTILQFASSPEEDAATVADNGAPAAAVARPTRIQAFAVCTGLIASLLLGGTMIKLSDYYIPSYKLEETTLKAMNSALDSIPDDASVQATNLLTPYLSDHLELYDIEYNIGSGNPFTTEYVAVDLRPFSGYRGSKIETFVDGLLSENYDIVVNIDETVMILKRSEP